MIFDKLQVDSIATIANAIIVITVVIIYRRLKTTTVNLKGRTALITGGASGIGLATAKAFAKIGMNIVIWDKNEEKMKETRSAIESQLKEGYYLIQQKVDVTSNSQIETAHSQLKRKLSEIKQDFVSVIVNNAGIVYKQSFLDMDVNETENVFAVNTLSVFSVIRTFFPDLSNQRVSNIVNISSLASRLPAAYLSSYCASKAATRAMTDCIRVELKATNNDHIRVCTVSPQFVDTGMFEGSYSNKFPGHRLKNLIFPPNSPEDIAKEIVFAITHERDEVTLPRISQLIFAIMDVIPHVVTDYLYMFLGGSHGMDTFKGRGKEWNRSYRLDSIREESYNEDTILSCSTRSC